MTPTTSSITSSSSTSITSMDASLLLGVAITTRIFTPGRPTRMMVNRRMRIQNLKTTRRIKIRRKIRRLHWLLVIAIIATCCCCCACRVLHFNGILVDAWSPSQQHHQQQRRSSSGSSDSNTRRRSITTTVFMSTSSSSSSSDHNNNNNNTTTTATQNNNNNSNLDNKDTTTNMMIMQQQQQMGQMQQRLNYLEEVVSHQATELERLQQECKSLNHVANSFFKVLENLQFQQQQQQKQQQASSSSSSSTRKSKQQPDYHKKDKIKQQPSSSQDDNDDDNAQEEEDDDDQDDEGESSSSSLSYPEQEIFFDCHPPANVLEAADAAGASILSSLLAGHQRILVDVRDADLMMSTALSSTSLSRKSSNIDNDRNNNSKKNDNDDDLLVQFLELAILPVAASLEGLTSVPRNRLRVVFSSLAQLLQYRSHCALILASEPNGVVALSTLGFYNDIIKHNNNMENNNENNNNNNNDEEDRDNIIVLIAPHPDDEQGVAAMNKLLSETGNTNDNAVNSNNKQGSSSSSSSSSSSIIRQPIIVINPHMKPVQGPAAHFQVAYQLRILSVHYNVTAPIATDSSSSSLFSSIFPSKTNQRDGKHKKKHGIQPETTPDRKGKPESPNRKGTPSSSLSLSETAGDDNMDEDEINDLLSSSSQTDAFLSSSQDQEEPPTPLQETQQEMVAGVTRAMVIRAYPHPWHVLVDTMLSETTSQEYVTAATFDVEPQLHDIQKAVVDCLQGSREEDELVAQQMQQALEAGQLDRVSEMLQRMGMNVLDDDEDENDYDDDEDDDDLWRVDKVDSI